MTTIQKRSDLFTCCLAAISLLLGRMLYRQTPPTFSQSAAVLPVYAVNYHLTLPDPAWGGGSNPENPLAFIRLTGPAYAQPGGTASYALTLANYEAMTRTFTLTDTLPAALTYIPNSNRELRYNPVTRQLTWQGDIAPGHLDYFLEPSGLSLPYIDLADFGAPNLCDELITTQGNCDEANHSLNPKSAYVAVLHILATRRMNLMFATVVMDDQLSIGCMFMADTALKLNYFSI